MFYLWCLIINLISCKVKRLTSEKKDLWCYRKCSLIICEYKIKPTTNPIIDLWLLWISSVINGRGVTRVNGVRSKTKFCASKIFLLMSPGLQNIWGFRERVCQFLYFFHFFHQIFRLPKFGARGTCLPCPPPSYTPDKREWEGGFGSSPRWFLFLKR